MRPDTSEDTGALGSWPGSRMVAARFADASNDVAPTKRTSRLGFDRVGPARELAAARHEIAVLRWKDAALGPELRAGGRT